MLTSESSAASDKASSSLGIAMPMGTGVDDLRAFPICEVARATRINEHQIECARALLLVYVCVQDSDSPTLKRQRSTQHTTQSPPNARKMMHNPKTIHVPMLAWFGVSAFAAVPVAGARRSALCSDRRTSQGRSTSASPGLCAHRRCSAQGLQGHPTAPSCWA